MGALVWLLVFIVANIGLNYFTSGRLASTGLDFILPAIILVANARGPAWGLIAAFLIICAHFFSALDKLHRIPFALLTGSITAVVIGVMDTSLQSATTIGLAVYHSISFLAVVLFYQSMGMRYLLFVIVNIIFSAWVLGSFY